MNRTRPLLIILSLASPPAPRPNILLIVADDLGWGDLGCYGGDLATPRLDALAAEGVRFTDFSTTASVCTPSRYSILSGRLPARALAGLDRVGMMFEPDHRSHRLTAAEPTLAELLRGAGYRTALFGKWHLGHGDTGALPLAHGFDDFTGCAGGCIDSYTHAYGDLPDWYRGDQPAPEPGFATELITRHAADWLARDDPRPFFLVVSYTAPHYGKSLAERLPSPSLATQKAGKPRPDPLGPGTVQPVNSLQVPLDALDALAGADPFAPTAAQKRRAYAAMVASMDDGVGELLRTLDAAGRTQDTLVIFLADNGPDETPSNAGDSGPLRGAKHSLHEGGVRVPCLMRWPGRTEAGSVEAATSSTLDLLPTLAQLAGRPPRGWVLDGLDLGPVWFGGGAAGERELMWAEGNSRSIRRGDWKWIDGALYDLAADLGETTDLAADRPELARELESALQEWLNALKADRPSLSAAQIAGEWRLYGAVFPALPASGYPLRLHADGRAETANLGGVARWRSLDSGGIELLGAAGESKSQFPWYDPAAQVFHGVLAGQPARVERP